MVKKNRFLSRIKRKIAPYVGYLPRVAVPILLIGLFIYLSFLIIPRLFSFLKSPSSTALSFIQSPQKTLRTTADRTNVVLLGKGGASHETPDITDTIMFVSYHHPTGNTLLLSLPRDIWVESLKARINTAYYYGNLKKSDGGLILAKASVEEIINQQVHYIAVIDFNGFIKTIDLLGGIDVNVKNELDDYKYPIPGKENAKNINDRYEHLHFDSGSQTMDGQSALKYVRSRNAEGQQGTDFARSARQQQVILSLLSKTISSKTLLQPSKIKQLSKLLSSSIDTDIKNSHLTGFIKLALKFNSSKITSASLDQGDQDSGRPGLLIKADPSGYNGQWVLTGRDNSWDEVQQYVKDLLSP